MFELLLSYVAAIAFDIHLNPGVMNGTVWFRCLGIPTLFTLV
jgi:hypothetical protein